MLAEEGVHTKPGTRYKLGEAIIIIIVYWDGQDIEHKSDNIDQLASLGYQGRGEGEHTKSEVKHQLEEAIVSTTGKGSS